MSINKVILVATLGADPELRYTPGGQAVCDLRMATNESYTKDGQKHESTEWHTVTVWAKQAENCAQYLSKGRQVYVEGRLKTDTYDKEGQKHYRTKIVAQVVQFLGGKGDGGVGREPGEKREPGVKRDTKDAVPPAPPDEAPDDGDGSVPF
jgi:single-strand DNA-binding protein